MRVLLRYCRKYELTLATVNGQVSEVTFAELHRADQKSNIYIYATKIFNNNIVKKLLFGIKI